MPPSNSPTPESPWTTHRTREVYSNPWIRVTESDVINPGGGAGIYGVVHFQNLAVGVVPVDDEDHTWLVGQYRYPTDTYEWEIPEGGGHPNESPVECARRELVEETGLEAESFHELFRDLQLSNSVTNERGWLYLARNLRQGQAAPEESEALRLRRLPLREAIAMAEKGEIRDVLSVVALLSLKGGLPI